MTVAVRIQGISKRYTIRRSSAPVYGSLRETLMRGMRKVLRTGTRSAGYSSKEEFWALNDVTFNVHQGERLGIIGRNGAGKSTLLKLMSRVTEPTSGRIELRGTVSSLLEVGTGFHPELTGRENIFLNGAILGMPSREIQRKFDDIVAFADVERFLDTPVKHYSSGMYVRLAFAVAAYLEPEILIVDEVLAVGDVQFQRRCLGRMEELSKSGRTVIFVTHNMDALTSLCTKGVLLDRGAVTFEGPAKEARARYLQGAAELEYSITSNAIRGGSGGVNVTDVWLEDDQGRRTTTFTSRDPVSVCLNATVAQEFVGRSDLEVAFSINTIEGHRLFTVVSSWVNDTLEVTTTDFAVACDLPNIPLVPGRYLVDATMIFHGDTLDCVQHCAAFEILAPVEGFYAARLAEHGALDLSARFRNRSHS